MKFVLKLFGEVEMLEDPVDAPPAKRGAIKAAAKENLMKLTRCSHGSDGSDVAAVKTAIGRAHKGNVRSYLQVQSHGDDRKRLWCEVTSRASNSHFEIITKVRDAVVNGTVRDAVSAKQMSKTLVESFGV